MKDWTSGTIVSTADPHRETEIRYFRSGGNKPPMVLVHGFTDSALYFTRVAEHFREQWDVIAYDARGHGSSGRAGTAFDSETRVEDLHQVVNGLQLNRPVFIGHSMGAATIAHAVGAIAKPLAARTIVLEDPAWFEPTPHEQESSTSSRAQYLAGWRSWVQEIQAAERAKAIEERTDQEPFWHPTDIETSIDARRQFQVDLFDHFPPAVSPWRSIVQNISCRTLLMIGGNVDRGRIITPELAAEAALLNPLLTWTQLDNAGHHLRFDSFDEYLTAVDEYLGSTE
jgi:N-formylmaleamate deformylase